MTNGSVIHLHLQTTGSYKLCVQIILSRMAIMDFNSFLISKNWWIKMLSAVVFLLVFASSSSSSSFFLYWKLVQFRVPTEQWTVSEECPWKLRVSSFLTGWGCHGDLKEKGDGGRLTARSDTVIQNNYPPIDDIFLYRLDGASLCWFVHLLRVHMFLRYPTRT